MNKTEYPEWTRTKSKALLFILSGIVYYIADSYVTTTEALGIALLLIIGAVLYDSLTWLLQMIHLVYTGKTEIVLEEIIGHLIITIGLIFGFVLLWVFTQHITYSIYIVIPIAIIIFIISAAIMAVLHRVIRIKTGIAPFSKTTDKNKES